ncbi:MAG: hypothetical protein MI685_02825, partial [Chlorobiales bacterium]|nr:hypothetical protein [Chlorobiales bacterium]
VRELENIVERALILNPTGPLTFDQLNFTMESPGSSDDFLAETDNLNEMISRHIQKVLDKTGGKIHGPDGAAERLGINANTLRNRMDKLGMKYRKTYLE